MNQRLTEIRSWASRAFAVPFLLTALLLPHGANAELLRFDLTATFAPRDFTQTPIFGVDLYQFSPSAAPYVSRASFVLDTERVDFLHPAGTRPGSNFYTVDVYGYPLDAISEFQMSFGTKSWDLTDSQGFAFSLPTRIAAVHLLLGGLPSDPSGLAIRIGDLDGGMEYGAALCGDPCFFENRATVQQSSPGAVAFTSNMTWTVTRLSAVPEPSTTMLTALGIVLAFWLAQVRRPQKLVRRKAAVHVARASR